MLKYFAAMTVAFTERGLYEVVILTWSYLQFGWLWAVIVFMGMFVLNLVREFLRIWIFEEIA